MPFERRRVDRETGEVVSSELTLKPCGSKTCEVCGPKLRRRYVAHFARTFTERAKRVPVHFCTFTCDPKTEIDGEPLEPWETRKYAAHSWDKLAKRLRRRTDELDYFGSFEQHEDGRWHLHVVVAADFSAVDSGDRDAVAKMMREQAFGAGFGAVMDVKEVQPKGDSRGDDGRPETVAGAVGYVVKYVFKDVAQAEGEGERRNSVICSQGIGYHSAQAKEQRREHARQATGEEGAGEGDTVEEWQPLFIPERGEAGEYADTITPEDRERFERLDRTRATTTYREKQPDGTWIVWSYDPRTGRETSEHYDRWPDAEGARRIGPG